METQPGVRRTSATRRRFHPWIIKSFHTCTAPTHRGRKRWPSGSIRSCTVWKPQPGFHKTSETRGRWFPFSGHEFLRTSTSPTKPGTKTVVRRVDTALHGVEAPTWGSWSQHHSGIRCDPWIRNHSAVDAEGTCVHHYQLMYVHTELWLHYIW